MIKTQAAFPKTLEAYVRDSGAQGEAQARKVRAFGERSLQDAQDYLMQPARSDESAAAVVHNLRDVERALKMSIGLTAGFATKAQERLLALQQATALGVASSVKESSKVTVNTSAEAIQASWPRPDSQEGIRNMVSVLNDFTTNYAALAAIPHPAAVAQSLFQQHFVDNAGQTSHTSNEHDQATVTSSRWIFRPSVQTTQTDANHTDSSSATRHWQFSEGDKRLDAIKTIQDLKERLHMLHCVPANQGSAVAYQTVARIYTRPGTWLSNPKVVKEEQTALSRPLGTFDYQPERFAVPMTATG